VAQPLLAVQEGKDLSFYRRNLPHWHPEGKAIFVTWRLYGSLPAEVAKSTAKSGCATGKRFVMVDQFLDSASIGPRWLSDPEIADAVERTIFRGAELGHYVLYAYVIMSNHVHALLQTGLPLARVTGAIKGVSAKDANARLGRVGKPFWQDESFDHWVRNSAEFQRINLYIERNPVRAGLAARPEDWRWSSAFPEVVERLCKLAGSTATLVCAQDSQPGGGQGTGRSACATNVVAKEAMWSRYW
jgi:putative transposase